MFGTGVKQEATLLRRIEARPEWKGRLWTFNAGVPGFGPGREFACLASHFESLEPHIVIMALYTGNDLQDVSRFYEVLVKKQVKQPPASKKPQETKKVRHHLKGIWPLVTNHRYWSSGSKLCSLFFLYLRRLAVSRGWVDPALVYNTFLIESCGLGPRPRIDAALQLTGAAAGGANRYCLGRGAHFMVLIIPPVFLVDRAMFDLFFAVKKSYDRGQYSPDVLHEKLRGILRNQDIPFLDMLPVLRERLAGGSTLYHEEGHWNAAGHQEAADRIFDFLKSKGWL
jgi:hypothetical protein